MIKSNDSMPKNIPRIVNINLHQISSIELEPSTIFLWKFIFLFARVTFILLLYEIQVPQGPSCCLPPQSIEKSNLLDKLKKCFYLNYSIFI